MKIKIEFEDFWNNVSNIHRTPVECQARKNLRKYVNKDDMMNVFSTLWLEYNIADNEAEREKIGSYMCFDVIDKNKFVLSMLRYGVIFEKILV